MLFYSDHDKLSLSLMNKKTRTIVLYAFIAFFPGILRAGPVESIPQDLPLKTGQIIGISEMIKDPSTFFFESFTGSRYGHIGVIGDKENGRWQVYHSNPPAVQKSDISDFLERSRDASGKFNYTIVEPASPLSNGEEKVLIDQMRRMLGTPYNYEQYLNSHSVNCSEFVYKAFQNIGREKIGEIEKIIDDTNFKSFDGALYGLYANPAVTLPKDAYGITPVSIINSPKVRVVRARLPVERLLSDREIYESWEKGGGLKAFERALGPIAALHKINIDDFMKKLDTASHRPRALQPFRPYPLSWRQPPQK